MLASCILNRAKQVRGQFLIAIGIPMVAGLGHAQFTPSRMYVWPQSPNSVQDGTAWNSAWHTLDQALSAQAANGEIWVATGYTYNANLPTNYTTGFLITKPLKIYGGLTVSTGTLASRTTTDMNNCVLEGGFGLGGAYAYHVVSIQEDKTDPVVIDGFKMENAHANDPLNSGSTDGGGIYAYCANLSLANVLVTGNSADNGGGLFFQGGCAYHDDPPTPPASHPRQLTIKNSRFTHNVADIFGGGIFGDQVYGEIVDVAFWDDHATQKGGGVYLWNMGASNLLTFMNCEFDKCHTSAIAHGAGGVYLDETSASPPVGGNATLVNCTFAQNYCAVHDSGQVVSVSASSQLTIANSILWRNYALVQHYADPIYYAALLPNITINDTDIDHGWNGMGSHIIMGNPGFNDTLQDDQDETTEDNLTLHDSTSPCVDAADWDVRPHDDLDVNGDGNVTQLVPIDLAMLNRTYNAGQGGASGHGGHGTRNYLDMGAFEFQGP